MGRSKITGYEYTVRILVEGDWYHAHPENLEELLGQVIAEDTERGRVEVEVLHETWVGP